MASVSLPSSWSACRKPAVHQPTTALQRPQEKRLHQPTTALQRPQECAGRLHKLWWTSEVEENCTVVAQLQRLHQPVTAQQRPQENARRLQPLRWSSDVEAKPLASQLLHVHKPGPDDRHSAGVPAVEGLSEGAAAVERLSKGVGCSLGRRSLVHHYLTARRTGATSGPGQSRGVPWPSGPGHKAQHPWALQCAHSDIQQSLPTACTLVTSTRAPLVHQRCPPSLTALPTSTSASLVYQQCPPSLCTLPTSSSSSSFASSRQPGVPRQAVSNSRAYRGLVGRVGVPYWSTSPVLQGALFNSREYWGLAAPCAGDIQDLTEVAAGTSEVGAKAAGAGDKSTTADSDGSDVIVEAEGTDGSKNLPEDSEGVRAGAGAPVVDIGFTRRNELLVGRVAMLGFMASLIGEAFTGKGPLAQFNMETGIPIYDEESLLLFFILFTLIGAVRGFDSRGAVNFRNDTEEGQKSAKPKRTSIRTYLGLPEAGPLFTFSTPNELFVGRVAQVGFASAIIGEILTGKGALAQLKLETGIPISEMEPLLVLSVAFFFLSSINPETGRFFGNRDVDEDDD